MATILTEINSDLTFQFNDDPLVKKYRAKLGKLLLEGMFCTKFERRELDIQAQKDQMHRQITGRKIQLLKAAQRTQEHVRAYREDISEHSLNPEIWAFLHINCPVERKSFLIHLKTQ